MLNGNGGASAGSTSAQALSATRKLDPVVTEIVRNAVVAYTEEMKSDLMRTAYSMIIYEGQKSRTPR